MSPWIRETKGPSLTDETWLLDWTLGPLGPTTLGNMGFSVEVPEPLVLACLALLAIVLRRRV